MPAVARIGKQFMKDIEITVGAKNSGSQQFHMSLPCKRT
jgi:hypothetical protein